MINKMSFNLKYSNPKQFLNILESVISITEQTNVYFTKEGMKISCMDSSHVAYIDLMIEKGDFSEYILLSDTDIVLGINFSAFCLLPYTLQQ